MTGCSINSRNYLKGEQFTDVPRESPTKKGNLTELSKIPASGFTKLVSGSASPNGRFAVGVGILDGKIPEWEALDRGDGDRSFVLKFDNHSDAVNYLIDVPSDRVVGVLAGDHFGTSAWYNHRLYQISWSEDNHWLLEVGTGKWETFACMVYRLDANGNQIAQMNFMPVTEAVISKFLRSRYPQLAQDEIARYVVTIEENARIIKEGKLTFKLSAQVPKEAYPAVQLDVSAQVERLKNGKISFKVTKVEEIKNEDE